MKRHWITGFSDLRWQAECGAEPKSGAFRRGLVTCKDCLSCDQLEFPLLSHKEAGYTLPLLSAELGKVFDLTRALEACRHLSQGRRIDLMRREHALALEKHRELVRHLRIAAELMSYYEPVHLLNRHDGRWQTECGDEGVCTQSLEKVSCLQCLEAVAERM